MFQYKAFIDNGQIKIIDSAGFDYEKEIAQKTHASQVFSTNILISLIVCGFSSWLAISPFFIEFLSEVQAIIFVFFAVIGAFLAIYSWNKLNETERIQKNLIQEFNLAKECLQHEIVILQAKLT